MEISVGGINHFLTIETASNEIMPHSVFSFMQMVEDKKWNDANMHSFEHIAMATTDGFTAERIDDLKEYKLLFPEFSEKYPHVVNTVGFSGRPGGPEFYINIDDNTHAHGPGGQRNHALAEEADSCFGKIVKGFDVLPLLKKNSPVVIKSMYRV